MSRMTLEEKILQTDQYYSGDFTTQDENGKVTAVDMQRFDAFLSPPRGIPSRFLILSMVFPMSVFIKLG